jgi:hypothetical protein
MMHCIGSGIHAFFLHRIRTQCTGTRARTRTLTQ